MRSLHTAATGMMAQELNVQVISNNIANMRTTGYKRQRAEFQDLLYQHLRRVGTQTSDQGNILPTGIELGSGVKTAGTPRIMSQGDVLPTEKELDIAIRGEGFFRVLLPDGRTAYSRDGSFELDAQGRLVTAQGYVIQPGLTLPQNARAVTVNSQGQMLGHPAGHQHAHPDRPARTVDASSTRPGCRRSATTSSWKRLRRARRRTAPPAMKGSATSSRATSNRRTSRRSTRSPT